MPGSTSITDRAAALAAWQGDAVRVWQERQFGCGRPAYVRARPERTLLYQLVREYYPASTAHLAAQGTLLQAARADADEPTPAECRAGMTCAQHLKRVFGIDIDHSAGLSIDTAAGCHAAVSPKRPAQPARSGHRT